MHPYTSAGCLKLSFLMHQISCSPWGCWEVGLKQVEGNEEYHRVIDDPSSALEILFWGLIFVIRGRRKKRVRDYVFGVEGGELQAYCVNFLSLSPVGQVNSLGGDSSGAGVWPARLKMALVHSCHVAFLSPAVCPLSWTQLVIRRANIFMEWPTSPVHRSFICRAQNSFVTL